LLGYNTLVGFSFRCYVLTKIVLGDVDQRKTREYLLA
jgi:hypothetical protein